jgi:hypothetical protein
MAPRRRRPTLGTTSDPVKEKEAMSDRATVDDELRSQAVKRLKRKRDFIRNLVIFALVNGGLWAIWATNGADTGDLWPAFVTGIWAVLLLLDLFKIFERPITDQDIRDEVDRLRHA